MNITLFTLSRILEIIIRISPNANKGKKLVQNFSLKNDLTGQGEDLITQNAFPSREIAGKENRIPVAAITKPVNPRLMNEIKAVDTVWILKDLRLNI